MILQRLQFPGKADANIVKMYYRYSNGSGFSDGLNSCVLMKAGKELKFDTYFNSFSYEKWLSYTILKRVSLSLKLKGEWEVILIRSELNSAGLVDEYSVDAKRIQCEDIEEFTFDYNIPPENGLLSFKLRAIKDSEFHGGAYVTDIDESSLPDVNIAVCICTYKREYYISRNMENLCGAVFNNKNSLLNSHLRVYIADNGQTLDENETGSDKIKIFRNLNSGGSGGFSRAIMEASAEKDKYNTTHVILMDDDTLFTEYALERNYVFLRLLKKEKRDSFIGGTMLRLDHPYMVHAAGETFNLHVGKTFSQSIDFNKRNYNLFKIENCLKTELKEFANYLGWWYFCMPLHKESTNDLSLPLFCQCDDIEFNLRHSLTEKITLGGICLWHEAFEKKLSISKDYYSMRNRLIMLSLHADKKLSKFYFQMLIMWHVARMLCAYKYKDARLWIRAVEDFFKGFEWLASQNPQALNTEIMSCADQMLPVESLPINFSYRKLKQGSDRKDNKIRILLRYITMNGWLLAARGKTIVSAANPNLSFIFTKKQVLYYDINTQKGYIAQKSWAEFFKIVGCLIKVIWKIQVKFHKTARKYKRDYPKYISKHFWKSYLGLENSDVK